MHIRWKWPATGKGRLAHILSRIFHQMKIKSPGPIVRMDFPKGKTEPGIKRTGHLGGSDDDPVNFRPDPDSLQPPLHQLPPDASAVMRRVDYIPAQTGDSTLVREVDSPAPHELMIDLRDEVFLAFMLKVVRQIGFLFR